MSELRRAIQDLIRNEFTVTIKRGVVDSFDTTKDTCVITPSDGSAVYEGVKLRSIEKEATATSSRLVIYPKVGSSVLFGVVENISTDAFVIEVSEIDSVMIEMNPDLKINVKADMTVEIDSPKVVFNQGTLGGLVKVNDLVTKLNAVESSLNTLKSLFNSWVPVAGDGGAALKGLSAGWAFSSLTLSTAIALENPKIKQ